MSEDLYCSNSGEEPAVQQLEPERQRSPAEGAQIARENPNEITGNVGGRGRKNGGKESEAEVFPSIVFWEVGTLRKMKKILTYNDHIPSCFNKEPSLRTTHHQLL